MNYKSFFIAIASLLLFSSCFNEGEQIQINAKDITIVADNITFVHEDGTPLATNECILPTSKYAVLISAKLEGTVPSLDLTLKPAVIKYMLNGNLYETTFLKEEDQLLNTTKLINGTNTAEIMDTTLKAALYLTSHDDFVRVP